MKFDPKDFENVWTKLKATTAVEAANTANVKLEEWLASEALKIVSFSESKRLSVMLKSALERTRIKNEELKALLKDLLKHASKTAPVYMGGTPSMFGPEYTDEEIKETDSTDAWDCYEYNMRLLANRAAKLLKD